MRDLQIRFLCLVLCLCLPLSLGAAASAAETEAAQSSSAAAAESEPEGSSALGAALAGALCSQAMPESVETAQTLAVTITLGGEAAPESLSGSAYNASVALPAGETLEIRPQEAGEKLYGLYIVWAAAPGTWTLAYGGRTAEREDGYLHAYVAIPEGAEAVQISARQDEALCYVWAYTAGVLPEEVQRWQPPCERADILLFPAHADDEILFFGGVLAEYAGERDLAVQVAYFSQYDGIRAHEELDGLWAIGVENYPVSGTFQDKYQYTLKEAQDFYGQEESEAFFAEQIRRFRPQICICHDAGGEYGHGTHRLVSAAARAAVENCGDGSYCPDSAEVYGTWDVPKTYLHLWKENKIQLDCRQPLEAFGGRTALEAAKDAYLLHVSQQVCSFYVSDTNSYSIAEFGLYRSTVGSDTAADMMEHLSAYSEQESGQ